MVGTRVYPDEPSGSFPMPPTTVEDTTGRTIEIRAFDHLDPAVDRSVDDRECDEADADTGVDSDAKGDAPGSEPANRHEVESAGRASTLESDPIDALTRMYVAFDPTDRAQGIPPRGESRVRDWLDSIVPKGLNVIAIHDGNVVGHATLVPDATDDVANWDEAIADPDAMEWELAIFVLQEYQRAGIGTQLLEHLLGYASHHDVERVWLTVERWNTPAIALYERVGFEPSGTESFELEMSIVLE